MSITTFDFLFVVSPVILNLPKANLMTGFIKTLYFLLISHHPRMTGFVCYLVRSDKSIIFPEDVFPKKRAILGFQSVQPSIFPASQLLDSGE